MTEKSKPSQGSVKALLVLFLFLTLPLIQVHAQADEDCMMCHEDKEMTGTIRGRTISMFVDTTIFSKSVHHSNTCLSCHTDAADEGFPHADDLKPVNCGNCHTGQMTDNVRGIHGQALLLNDPNAPSCKECHGHHDILHYSDPNRAPIK